MITPREILAAVLTPRRVALVLLLVVAFTGNAAHGCSGDDRRGGRSFTAVTR